MGAGECMILMQGMAEPADCSESDMRAGRSSNVHGALMKDFEFSDWMVDENCSLLVRKKEFVEGGLPYIQYVGD